MLSLIKRLVGTKPDQASSSTSSHSSSKSTPSSKPKHSNVSAKTQQKSKPKTVAPSKKKSEEIIQWMTVEDIAAKIPAVDGKVRFVDIDLHPKLQHNIYASGLEYATDIQSHALPITTAHGDIIGKAQTGTGKTAAFLITLLNNLLLDPPAEKYAGEPLSLVLAPTRELALQIEKDVVLLSKGLGINYLSIIGGQNIQDQQRSLESRVTDIVIATPGRLIDLMFRNDIYLDQVETLVLDEADQMLDMGFMPDLKRIVRKCPQNDVRQTLLFSATFKGDMKYLAYEWTQNPVLIEIEPEQVATAAIEQRIYLLESRQKNEMLLHCLTHETINKVIVFCNTRIKTRTVHEFLKRKGFKAVILSGEITQDKRLKALQKFKSGEMNILVATDVAGRGIHVDDVSHVINYELPEDSEDYVHRIGRTGRAGKKGIAISLAGEQDVFVLPDIEDYLGNTIERHPFPF